MMKSKYLAVALSAVALTACNNDEVMEVNQGRGISFQVATEASTRAAATTTNTITEFKVWGFTGDPAQTLMNGIKVSKADGKWSYGDAIFWPESDVDFYSVSPAENCGGTVSITKDKQEITGFTVNADQASQVDLLYAVNKGEKKEEHEASDVNINFRHALSQIIFKAKNTNSNLKVSIKDVKVVNVVKGGDFTYPTSSTTTQNKSESGTIESSTQGTWTLLSQGNYKETYAAGTNAAGVELTTKNQVYDLTTTTGTGESKVYTGALFLMPQDLEPWNLKGKSDNNGGSYFLVNCQLKNVSGDDEVQLWPSEANGYGYVAIPTSDIKWEQGKKYIYTFIFGEGGGYIPPVDPEDPDEEPEDGGDPVLVPITFEVTVDEFINGDEQNIDMIEKDEAGE